MVSICVQLDERDWKATKVERRITIERIRVERSQQEHERELSQETGLISSPVASDI
jgi:hypothetical protein